MTNQPDPIQAAIDALEQNYFESFFGEDHELSVVVSKEKFYYALEQLRAHQSEVAELKAAVRDLGKYLQPEFHYEMRKKHAATIKTAGGE